MSADESGNVTPGDENPLDNYQSSFGTDIELETEDVFNVPSPHITPARMLQLKQRIDKAAHEGVDGVVVTHGTDTLEETAYFLDLTLPNELPVVICSRRNAVRRMRLGRMVCIISKRRFKRLVHRMRPKKVF